METIDPTPLGFSDLTTDEAFIITAFRRWKHSAVGCKEIGRDVSGRYRSDSWYDGLQLIFNHYGDFTVQIKSGLERDQSTLTPFEESLLDEIGKSDKNSKQWVRSFQRVSANEGVEIRSVCKIPRSGRDFLLNIIERKTAAVNRFLYPEPRGVRSV